MLCASDGRKKVERRKQEGGLEMSYREQIEEAVLQEVNHAIK